MTTIIEFKGGGGRAGPREGSQTHGEIIIFPGVRRERHTGDPELEDAPRRSKRQGRAKPKRDLIEIPD